MSTWLCECENCGRTWKDWWAEGSGDEPGDELECPRCGSDQLDVERKEER